MLENVIEKKDPVETPGSIVTHIYAMNQVFFERYGG